MSANGNVEQLHSFEAVVGRDTWYAGSAIIDGQRVGLPLGVRSIAATTDGRVLLANVKAASTHERDRYPVEVLK